VWIKVGSLHFFENETYLTSVLSCRGFLKIKCQTQERLFNNYKDYSEETLQRLMSVKLIKSFGFTLNEASSLLDMIEMNEATCTNVSDKIKEKVRLLDEKIKELRKIKTLLLNGMKNCQGVCNPSKTEENCPIIVAPKV
jgi:DNA-binding transcriptional MerR regulator